MTHYSCTLDQLILRPSPMKCLSLFGCSHYLEKLVYFLPRQPLYGMTTLASYLIANIPLFHIHIKLVEVDYDHIVHERVHVCQDTTSLLSLNSRLDCWHFYLPLYLLIALLFFRPSSMSSSTNWALGAMPRIYIYIYISFSCILEPSSIKISIPSMTTISDGLAGIHKTRSSKTSLMISWLVNSANQNFVSSTSSYLMIRTS